MTPERATAPVAAITDMANHLRRVVVNRGAGTISVQSKLLLQAADECDRFYSGMVNWKANAVEKDAEIIRLRTALAAASQAQAEPVAWMADNGNVITKANYDDTSANMRRTYHIPLVRGDAARVVAAAGATPAPVAAITDERALFEAWAREVCNMPVDVKVNWDALWTKQAWEGWNARAALSSAPMAHAEPVARVDAGDDGMFAEILPNVSVKIGQHLYAAPVATTPAAPAAPSEQDMMEWAVQAGLFPNTIHQWMPALTRYTEAVLSARAAIARPTAPAADQAEG